MPDPIPPDDDDVTDPDPTDVEPVIVEEEPVGPNIDMMTRFGRECMENP